MLNKEKKSRGFGFVIFKHYSSLQDILTKPNHVLDDKIIECKQAVPKDNDSVSTFSKNNNNNNLEQQRKVFIGGLPLNSQEDILTFYFSYFGKVEKVRILRDKHSGKARGFGFVVFENEKSVDCVLNCPQHIIQGKVVECKRSIPKNAVSDNKSNSIIKDTNYFYSNDETNENNYYNANNYNNFNNHNNYNHNNYNSYPVNQMLDNVSRNSNNPNYVQNNYFTTNYQSNIINENNSNRNNNNSINSNINNSNYINQFNYNNHINNNYNANLYSTDNTNQYLNEIISNNYMNKSLDKPFEKLNISNFDNCSKINNLSSTMDDNSNFPNDIIHEIKIDVLKKTLNDNKYYPSPLHVIKPKNKLNLNQSFSNNSKCCEFQVDESIINNVIDLKNMPDFISSTDKLSNKENIESVRDYFKTDLSYDNMKTIMYKKAESNYNNYLNYKLTDKNSYKLGASISNKSNKSEDTKVQYDILMFNNKAFDEIVNNVNKEMKNYFGCIIPCVESKKYINLK